jgi:NTE family protein
VTAGRALVLAGGGVAGIAWELGVLRGIAEESTRIAQCLLDSEVLVGTSAGSAVAAQIGSGRSIGDLYARQVQETSAELDPGVSIDDVTELFQTALTDPFAPLPTKLQRIGALALASGTVPEPVRREVIAHRLPSHDWPDRDLRITAIDVATGQRVVFTKASGIDLVDAVAASCAVPGAWPPVTIGERRYMDGGVGSSINLDVADDCAEAVVLVPASESAPSPFGSGHAAEIAAFGGHATAVFADDGSLSAFGTNPLDPRCRTASAQAGRAQGRRAAERIAAFLERGDGNSVSC